MPPSPYIMPASDRVFTFSFPTAEDKTRWKKLAEPLCLNHWIFLMVEKALEDAPVTTNTTTDDINALRKENLDLRKENEALAAKLDQIRAREVEDILERSSNAPMQMDKHVVDLLRSGGYWTSTKLMKKLVQESAPSERMHAFRMDDKAASNNSITADFFSNINDNIVLEVDVKAVERTLEALEQIGLVKKSWQGWKWNKT